MDIITLWGGTPSQRDALYNALASSRFDRGISLARSYAPGSTLDHVRGTLRFLSEASRHADVAVLYLPIFGATPTALQLDLACEFLAPIVAQKTDWVWRHHCLPPAPAPANEAGTRLHEPPLPDWLDARFAQLGWTLYPLPDHLLDSLDEAIDYLLTDAWKVPIERAALQALQSVSGSPPAPRSRL